MHAKTTATMVSGLFSLSYAYRTQYAIALKLFHARLLIPNKTNVKPPRVITG